MPADNARLRIVAMARLTVTSHETDAHRQRGLTLRDGKGFAFARHGREDRQVARALHQCWGRLAARGERPRQAGVEVLALATIAHPRGSGAVIGAEAFTACGARS
jgi:hypothetical protein